MENKLITILKQIAYDAGQLILEVYNSNDFDIKIKTDNSPLTLADKRSHDFIAAALEKSFPDIPVLSEEGTYIEYNERKKWNEFFLVDPLDGTKEFIKKNGEFTVNIALIKNQKPVLGVINVPVSGEIYYGSVEDGSYKQLNGNSEKIEVSKRSKDGELTVVQSRSHSGNEENEFYSKYKVKESISKGSSLKICMVAEGKAELYFRGGPTWEWDTAAGHAILISAGGFFTNKDYSSLLYNKEVPKNYGFIASSFHIADE